MTTGHIVAMGTAALMSIGHAAVGQTVGDWNRKITDFSMTASAGGPPGTCDVTVEWQFEVLTAGATFGDLTTEIALQINGLELASLTTVASDIGAPSGGGDPALCPVAACAGACGFVLFDTATAPMNCLTRNSACRCQSPVLTTVFPAVPFAPGDEIMVLLRPAPGALPDPNPDDDNATITFGSWNRRMTAIDLQPAIGGPTGLYDISGRWLIDLTEQSEIDQNIGIEMDLFINGILQATEASDDCLIWDIESPEVCASAPDGTACGTATLSGQSSPPVCDGDNCSAGPLSLTFPSVPLQPEDEIMVLLRPAPGALPEPDASDDNAMLTFGSWNRRVRSVLLEPTAGGPPDTYDLTAQWALDLRDQSTMPAEVGVEVELRINGVPQGMTTSEDCILWDITDNGGNGDCAADGDVCGELIISGQSAQALIDGPVGTCSAPPLTAAFPGVPLAPGDEIMVLLRPAPGALPDADEDDDIGILYFGSWNRRLESVDVVPTPGGPPDTFNVTAVMIIEMTAETNMMLQLAVDTEPYGADPCCEEACCCPQCSCSEDGCGGGGSNNGLLTVSNIGSSGAPLVCPSGECPGTCGEGCTIDASFEMNCDPDDCICRSDPFVLTWTDQIFEPGGEITVKLVPAPGALPELPGFPDDDEQTVPVPGGCMSVADCADLDADGIRDNGCVWWACETSGCVGTDVSYADMGGSNGACPPDSAADSNDRFHALNCFSNQNTLGVPPYLCEDNPPTAYNVDAAGLGAACSPDGVCDGNDAFAALNAFSGDTTCSCAVGPAPQQGGFTDHNVTAEAALALRSDRDSIRAGQLVHVHALLNSTLADLRGYQLHVAVSGGLSGRLVLQDIAIRDDAAKAGHVFAGLPYWVAFNTETAQMVAGLDAAGIRVAAGQVLATFTYEATADAAGAFVIDVLADPHDRSQRSVLFPTPSAGIIAIGDTESAIVTVEPRRTRHSVRSIPR